MVIDGCCRSGGGKSEKGVVMLSKRKKGEKGRDCDCEPRFWGREWCLVCLGVYKAVCVRIIGGGGYWIRRERRETERDDRERERRRDVREREREREQRRER